jgi:hypothetical protein
VLLGGWLTAELAARLKADVGGAALGDRRRCTRALAVERELEGGGAAASIALATSPHLDGGEAEGFAAFHAQARAGGGPAWRASSSSSGGRSRAGNWSTAACRIGAPHAR